MEKFGWRRGFKTLKFNIWIGFAVYAILIVMVLLLSQVAFLKPYYMATMKKKIVRLGDATVSAYASTGDHRVLENAVADNGVAIALVNSDYAIVRVPSYQKLDFTQKNLENFMNIVDSGAGNSVSYVDPTMGMDDYFVYGTKLSDDLYFYLSARLAPVEVTTSVLKDQLFIIMLILLVLGFLVAWASAERIGRPIQRISQQARKLGEGDYSTAFSGEGFAEVEDLAETLNYAAGELQKTDELRKELMANVSHDLRTPLTMVKAYAEMIRDISGENPEKRNEHAGVIIEEADRLAVLVEDILNLSRLERGSIPMERKRIDLSATCRRVMKHFAVLSEKDAYVFETEIADGLWVEADEARMEQVIYNLVSNAVNYTGDDKRVYVRLFPAGRNVRFEVRDTGAGIPEDQKKGIWDRYYRSKETHKRPVAGTGLGLSIVKNILSLHGAAFGVESGVGCGSTFWFELEQSAPASGVENGAASENNGRPLRQ